MIAVVSIIVPLAIALLILGITYCDHMNFPPTASQMSVCTECVKILKDVRRNGYWSNLVSFFTFGRLEPPTDEELLQRYEEQTLCEIGSKPHKAEYQRRSTVR